MSANETLNSVLLGTILIHIIVSIFTLINNIVVKLYKRYERDSLIILSGNMSDDDINIKDTMKYLELKHSITNYIGRR